MKDIKITKIAFTTERGTQVVEAFEEVWKSFLSHTKEEYKNTTFELVTQHATITIRKNPFSPKFSQE